MKARGAGRLDHRGDVQESLQITVPPITKKSLKILSAESGDPMRLIVLRALAAVGVQVPSEELQDRRKSR
jgi:hypothetical protein